MAHRVRLSNSSRREFREQPFQPHVNASPKGGGLIFAGRGHVRSMSSVLRVLCRAAHLMQRRPDGTKHSSHSFVTTDSCVDSKIMHDEHVKKTHQEIRPIPRDQQSRQRRGQAFEGIDEHDYRVGPRTGWRFKSSESQGNLSHSSSSTNWDRNNWTTRSWNSWHSSWSDIS